jgi:hypothetical protein
MPKPNPRDIPDVRANDPLNAERKFEDFTRRILAVPKREIDAKLEKKKKSRRN